MKACVVGKAEMRFTDDDSGEVIEGMNLYYFAPKDEVDGFFAGRMWVKKTSRLYAKVKELKCDIPVMANLDYEIQPGRRMQAVLEDIRAMTADEVAVIREHPYWGGFITMLMSSQLAGKKA